MTVHVASPLVDPNTSTRFFRSLLDTLSSRAAQTSMSVFRPRNRALQEFLLKRFNEPAGGVGSFVAEPVFEATFPWLASTTTMQDLVEQGLLAQALVDAMDTPTGATWTPEDRTRYAEHAFKKTWAPYTHQEESWRHLLAAPGNSLVVCSGTGSGKTESFMVPVLQDLLADSDTSHGVRAIFLYPLNALIASQRERIKAWTGGLQGRVSFALYSGETRDSDKTLVRLPPEERLTRSAIRETPPSVLITNPTMLEYILVRRDDAPILAASQGKLRWIVLDEAHTYRGSQAAEMALLLRRVLFAFGVERENVRFVATSATIGSDSTTAKEQLRNYLADLAGVETDKILVVDGQRDIDQLLGEANDADVRTFVDRFDAVPSSAHDQRSALVNDHQILRALRARFASPESRVQSQSDIITFLLHTFPDALNDVHSDRERRDLVVGLLDRARHAQTPRGHSFLPLRAHLFSRTQPGLWSCANTQCPEKPTSSEKLPTPDTGRTDATWHWGQLYLHERHQCTTCSSPILEVVGCRVCGEEALLAELGDLKNFSGRLPATATHILRHDPLVAREATELREREEDIAFVPLSEHDDTSLAAPADAPKPRRASRPPSTQNKPFDAPYVFSKGIIRPVRDGDINVDPTTIYYLHQDESGTRYLVREPQSPADILVRMNSRADRKTEPCGHCGNVASPKSGWRHFSAGSNLLLPVNTFALLEHSPPQRDPHGMVFEGRRVMTFSDSRQGTARFALFMDLDGQDRAVRGHLWKALAENDGTTSLDALRAQFPWANDETLEQLRGPGNARKSISWEHARNKLAGDLKTNSFHSMRRFFPNSDELSHSYAQLGLYREFGRYLPRGTSLENAGFASLTYASIENAVAPPEWYAALRHSMHDVDPNASWRDVLHFGVHIARRIGALDMRDQVRRALGTSVPYLELLPHGTEDLKSYQREWPRFGRPSKAIDSWEPTYLATALGLHGSNPEHRDIVDSILAKCWSELTNDHGILQRTNHSAGFVLSYKTAEIQRNDRVWMCPITRRLSPSNVLKLSLFYHPIEASAPVHEQRRLWTTHSVDIPWPSESQRASVQARRAWLTSDTQVMDLRQLGVWSEATDRFIENPAYTSAEEHSAQRSKEALEKAVEGFRQGTVNVLSSSTTMEMGIDMGSLSSVAMNNAPPGPANYLQRAGRAGRRSESAAVALTLCTPSPHASAIFARPTWPFVTSVRVPRVQLESRAIVRRHINSYLLGAFLTSGLTKGHNLTCASFFTPSRDSGPAYAFVDSLYDFSRFEAGVRAIVAGTILEHEPLDASLAHTATEVQRLGDLWREHYDALKAQIVATYPSYSPETFIAAGRLSDEQTSVIGLHKQLQRHEQEYLLSYLAQRQFLPGYGFPTHIIPFLNTTQNKEKSQNPLRSKLPSRPLSIALTEYAPDAQIVIGHAVHTCRGVTLNWKRPAGDLDDQYIRELQSLKPYRWCTQCTWWTDTPGGYDAQRRECPSCKRPALAVSSRVLEPAGFAIDIREAPTNVLKDVGVSRAPAVTRVDFGEAAPWQSLGLHQNVTFRTTSSAKVFHVNHGSRGEGFAVCMHCGRVASSIEGLHKHKPLRTISVDSEGREQLCPAGEMSMLSYTSLGGVYHTHAWELRLVHPHRPPLTREQATSIGVALRVALATRLDVDLSEIRSDVSKQENDGYSILLFDTAVSGAGLVHEAGPMILELLRDAMDILTCPSEDGASCERACPRCLIQWDTQRLSQSLDRHAALHFLDETFFALLELPEEKRVLGPETSVTTISVLSSLEARARRNLHASLRLFFYPCEVDLPVPLTMLQRIESLARSRHEGASVDLIFIDSASLSTQQRSSVAFMQKMGDALHGRLRIQSAETGPSLPSSFRLLAEVHGTTEDNASWALHTTSPQDLIAAAWNEAWGSVANETVGHRSVVAAPNVAPTTTPTTRWTPAAASVPPFQAGILRGKLSEVVRAHVRGLITHNTLTHAVGASVDRIEISDRYMRSPLAIAAWARWLQELCIQLQLQVRGAPLDITTQDREPATYYRAPRHWYHDIHPDLQADTIREVFSLVTALPTSVNVARSLHHQRRLTLHLTGGRALHVWFDQGMGFLRPTRTHDGGPSIAQVTGASSLATSLLADILVSVDTPSPIYGWIA